MRIKLSTSFAIDAEEEPWKTEGLRLAVFGQPGSGKSYLALLIAEQFLEQGGTIIAFEPRTEWEGLKAGFGEVLAVGGPYADVPLDVGSAKSYAEAVVKNGLSLVFNTGEIEDEEELVRFAEGFTARLLRLEEAEHRPILLVLEEAQDYLPRTAEGRIAPPWVFKRMIRRFKEVYQQGRKLGVSAMLISQRPQEVNFTCRTLSNLTFMGKFSATDLSYIEREIVKWLPTKVDVRVLLALKPGEFLAIASSGVERVAVTEPRKTPHLAETPSFTSKPKPVAVEEATRMLAESIRRTIEARRREEDELARLKGLLRERDRLIEELRERLRELEIALKAKEAIVASLEVKAKPVTVETSPAAPERRLKTAVLEEVKRGLPAYERRIVEFLEKYPCVEFTRYQLATALKLGPRSSRLTTAISRLRRLGLIPDKGKIRLLP